ncbi:MAG: hypothetical protein SFV15_14620 [Polyangiaceae bacterium]|nr:hypothetical protein [Polyangiaceae bacterium]
MLKSGTLGRRKTLDPKLDIVFWMSAAGDEDLEKLAMEHPVLKQAKDALDRLSADELAQIQAEHREMALLTYEAGISAARHEAEEKGRQEGRQEGEAEMLLRLLTIKFGPQPAEVAQRLASASQADVLRWSERMFSADSIDAIFA